MKAVSHFLSRYRYQILGLFILEVILILFSFSEIGKNVTNRAFDPLRSIPARDEVAIIAIDDKSLQTFGAWPWDRDVFARLTERLETLGVKSVAYDVLFLEPRAGDEEFRKALANTKMDIFLGAKYSNGNYFSSYLAEASAPNVKSAIVNVTPDMDGKVRKYAAFHNGDACAMTLSDAVFFSRTKKQPADCRDEQGYFRYPKDIAVYSLSDVALGVMREDQLRHKSVIIGATSLDLNDNFVSLAGRKIPGVYVHGSMLVSRLENVNDITLGAHGSAILILFSGFLGAAAIIFVRRLLLQLLAVCIVGALSILSAVVMFEKGHILPLPWLISGLILGSVFATLSLILHEKKEGEYVRSIFSKYVNKDILHKLLLSKESLSLNGEKRELTVMFSDLRGFTSLSETLAPEQLMSLLNGYMGAMAKPILGNQGTIDKFIGDAIMAFWNAPLHIANHEKLAVQTSLEMHAALIDFNLKHGTNLQMGIGIHTGDAVIGNVGSEERLNYTALGDTVNLASRVEGLTKKYGVGIIITEDVKKKLPPSFKLRKLDIVMVKGKNTKTILYEVLGVSCNMSIIEKYEEALQKYQDGEFDIAKQLFEELASEGDAPSFVMHERLSALDTNSSFDGVFVFNEK